MSKSKHGKLIDKVSSLKRKARLTPESNRYVDKATREKLGLQIPKKVKTLPDFLNAAEIWKLYDEASKINNYTRFLVEFLVMTGLRIGEATNLLVHDIDFYNKQFKVRSGKGSKDRYVPITESLSHKIKLFLVKRKKGYLFSKSNETQYTKRALQYKVTKAIRKCDFKKKLNTHSLRHTFACILLSKGMSLKQIGLLLGHDSEKTTEIYAKLELGSVKEEYMRIMGNE